MKIKICKKYKKRHILKEKLTQAFPESEVIIKDCIDLCKICKDRPTAKIKDKRFKAADISSLIEKIETKR